LSNRIIYERYTDEEIIGFIQQGEEYASEYIIDKYKDLVKIKARAYFIIGADKEDLIQEGMIGLFKAIRDFDHNKKASFFSFAELCINRQIITAIKSATRQKHIPLNSYISLNKQAFDSDTERSYFDLLADEKTTNPEDLFIDQEERDFIKKNINGVLSTFEYSVLNLYLKDKSYSEISKILDKSEKSIDNALQRVRKKIDKVISKKN
jgi:RNA polymerase sporulation-specific sigma factor